MNSTHWDPAVDPLLEACIDFTVPAWFGHIASDLSTVSNISYDLSSHVFPQEDWLPLITEMQAAQASGQGIVVAMNHTTISNRKYGISGGRSVAVVWVYLGRTTSWEVQLSDTMRQLVEPAEDPSNQANTISSGPFKKFPHYDTRLASIDFQQANLLADLCGWHIHNNQHIFKAAFGIHDQTGPESRSGKKPFFSSSVGIFLIFCIAVFCAGLV